ncbi:MAG: hypothetical protein EPO55_00755 [Reyranella sp.]|uniref:hypothetical protein n=1 Tax=Reyranella sp. TaxID=1929291 RepID=UPI001200E31E|nr:hypothetical protein [Reyranella sp.]TAJ42791.1 MAG: hypothetical protein EPO55_00755 [Reyranella sp.]
MTVTPRFQAARRQQPARAALLPPQLVRRRLCYWPERHPLPVPMELLRAELNRKGQPTAIFRCPLCRREEGLCIDFRTGRIRTLFQRG